MSKQKEPKLWVTVLKLIIGLIAIVWGTGAVLQWASKFDTELPKANSTDWGISRDSPIPSKR